MGKVDMQSRPRDPITLLKPYYPIINSYYLTSTLLFFPISLPWFALLSITHTADIEGIREYTEPQHLR